MTWSMTSLARYWLPPGLRDLTNRWLGGSLRFEPRGESWAQLSTEGGYDHPSILRRVAAATESVLRGDAAAEQDGRLLPTLPPPGPALPCVLAAHGMGRLRAVDFGGGLASHWLCWRPWLKHFDHEWHVVEQPSYVKAGRQLFTSHPGVSFHEKLAEALASCPQPDVILASSVLPYVSNPREIFTEFLRASPRWIVIDRTPFLDGSLDRLAMQINPPSNGNRRYPCWLFAAEAFVAEAEAQGYEMVVDWPGSDGAHRVGPLRVRYRGFALRRRAA